MNDYESPSSSNSSRVTTCIGFVTLVALDGFNQTNHASHIQSREEPQICFLYTTRGSTTNCDGGALESKSARLEQVLGMTIAASMPHQLELLAVHDAQPEKQRDRAGFQLPSQAAAPMPKTRSHSHRHENALVIECLCRCSAPSSTAQLSAGTELSHPVSYHTGLGRDLKIPES